MNAFLKDILRQIKMNLPRFFAILLIVSLGVAFFAGIGSTGNNMRLTVDKYYDEHNASDIKLVSTWGFEKEDVEKLKTLEYIKALDPTYTIDSLTRINDSPFVLKYQSMDFDKLRNNPDQVLFQPDLVEGELPQNKNECLIDAFVVETYGYKIGDTIEADLDDKDITENLSSTTFKITGIFNPIEHFTLTRGSTTKGSGTIAGFVLVDESNFDMEVYTQIFAKAYSDSNMSRFSAGYKEKIDTIESSIETLGKDISLARFNKTKEEIEEELKDGRTKIEDGKSEIEDGKKELEEAEKELKDGWKKFDDAEKELEKGRKKYGDEISSAEKELSDAKKQLNTAKKTLENKQVEYNKGKKEFDDGYKKWTEGGKLLEEGKAGLEKLNSNIKALKEQLKLVPENTPPWIQMSEQIKAFEKVYKENKADYDKEKAKYDAIGKTLEEKRGELKQGKSLLDSGFDEYNKGYNEYEKSLKLFVESKKTGAKELEDGQKELDENRKKLGDGQKEFDDNHAKVIKDIEDGEKEIAENEEKLNDGQKELNDLKKPEWFFLGLDKNEAFENYNQDSKRIDAISNVFPLVFFIVAALVSLTNMTRMVDDDRSSIGIYKALGYGSVAISLKYIVYAGIATVFGTIFGIIYGSLLFPNVIFNAYGMLYTLPKLVNPIYWPISLGAGFGAILCTMIPTLLVIQRNLRSTAASLMRPRAPKKGKRILLERISFLWKHLSFSVKVTFRNIFRYKKRLFMTVIGIMGCTALVFTGFAFQESITNMVPVQFDEIMRYDMIANIKENSNEADIEEMHQIFKEDPHINFVLDSHMEDFDIISGEGVVESLTAVVPLEKEHLYDFVTLRDRKTKEEFNLSDNGVILTEKIANILNISVGDKIEFRNEDNVTAEAVVEHIVENYIFHYVYLTKAFYEDAFGTAPAYNATLAQIKNREDTSADISELSEKLLESDAVSTVSHILDSRENFEDMMSALDIVVVILILSAAALAFVVLFSLTSINIDERKRELATLKVLGFYDNETRLYLFRENIILAFLGIVVGLFFGVLLTGFLIITVEINFVMFTRHFGWQNYLYAGVLTMAFTIVVNLIMGYSVKKIDMVESLKSVE